MKTTLVIDDGIMSQLKAEAARQRTTISYLVDSALRRMLNGTHEETAKLPPIPTFDCGELLVDIADRDALYDAMEEPI